MKDFESQKIKSVIKHLLRQKNITYETVADTMECSVPTVTRFLGAEELSLSRLLKLCDIVGIDLADLQRMMKTEEPKEERFTAEQEQFLVKNKNFLAYLIRLYAEETPKQIAEKNKLTQRSTDKYLLGLERQELIKVSAKQKVKPAFKSLPSFGRGPLGKAYYEAFIRNAGLFFINRIAEGFLTKTHDRATENSSISVRTLKVTETSYLQWIKERQNADRAFESLAAFEENTMNDADLMTAVIFDGRTLVPSDYVGLQFLNNTFGAIPNL